MSDHAYHHGDLRRALLREASGLIEERGLQALSLREVAARAGVSAAAPYHHFADKAALIRALGFEALAELDRELAVAEVGVSDPYERLLALGRAYVAFARRQPASAAVMRAPELSSPPLPGEAPEHGSARERLLGAVLAGQAAGVLPSGDPLPLAIGMWALVEGLVTLLPAAPSELTQQYGGPDGLADTVLRATVRSR